MDDLDAPVWEEMVLVGIVVRPHALRGEVIVQPETDFPEERFRDGATLFVGGAVGVPHRTLVIEQARSHAGRLIVAFDGLGRIEDAEELRNAELRVPAEELAALPAGQFYHHDLVGCEVVTTDGARVGRVIRVDGGGAASVLGVRGTVGEILVPLAAEICTEIDVAARRITIAPPEGLLELNA